MFVKESLIRASSARLWAFHELPDALERLTPPWESMHIVEKAQGLQVGATVIVETKLFGIIPVRWVARHTAYDPPHVFEDIQLSGPFKSWRHRHIITAHANGAILRDEVEYEPPLWLLGKLAAPIFIEPKLERMFVYRHKVTKVWCEAEEGAVEHG